MLLDAHIDRAVPFNIWLLLISAYVRIYVFRRILALVFTERSYDGSDRRICGVFMKNQLLVVVYEFEQTMEKILGDKLM